MRLARNFASLCLIVSAFSALPLPAVDASYRYEPDVVTLTGVLSTRIYPGAPNYESVKSGDLPNKIWLIRLPHPISMEPGPEPASFEGETGIKEIHVILTDLKDEKTLKQHGGETVTIIGKIFHAHTIHHPLPLILDVQSFKLHVSKRPD